MPSKAHRPRTRHIAFEVVPRDDGAQGALGRREVVGAVRGVTVGRLGRDALEEMDPWLTVFDGRRGLLRVNHTMQEEAVEVLRSITWVGDRDHRVVVRTLGVSGTIRAAKRRYLQENEG